MPAPVIQTAARHLVDTLVGQGVTHVFGVPGESYLAVLNAFWQRRDVIRFVSCRHEAAAATMAEAWGKLTSRPGIAFVTRGPGATQAAIGVHTAFQDSTPMILFIGQVARDQRDREAFQEIDYNRMFSGVAKHTEQIDVPQRMTEYVARAFATALNGRPGPVVLALPEDVLPELVACPAVARIERTEPAPDPAAIERLQKILATARQPLLLAGGPAWTAPSVSALKALAEQWQIPVATSFRAKDRIDNRHPNYAGDVGIAPNPALAGRVRQADVLIALGPRLGEMTTGGYSLLQSPRPEQQLVHIHTSGDELGRVFQPALAIQSGIGPALAAMARLSVPGWPDEVRAARADYERWIEPTDAQGPVNPALIWRWLDETLPADALVCNGAGNFSVWLHRFYQHKAWPTQLGPTSGAMGYGLPAAIAARLAHPGRTVVAVQGDGCFLMTGNELATVANEGLKIIILVFDNALYGTIRLHQERAYPGHIVGTQLTSPDFAAYARAFGLNGLTVTRTDDFAAAFAAAQAADAATLIHLRIDPVDIAPGRTLPV